MPPIEWPTSTSGPVGAVASITAARSAPTWSMVRRPDRAALGAAVAALVPPDGADPALQGEPLVVPGVQAEGVAVAHHDGEAVRVRLLRLVDLDVQLGAVVAGDDHRHLADRPERHLVLVLRQPAQHGPADRERARPRRRPPRRHRRRPGRCPRVMREVRRVTAQLSQRTRRPRGRCTGARQPAAGAGDHLVADRPGRLGPVLGGGAVAAVAEQDGEVAGRDVLSRTGSEVDHELVHAHAPGHRRADAAHLHRARARRVPRHAVGVTQRAPARAWWPPASCRRARTRPLVPQARP